MKFLKLILLITIFLLTGCIDRPPATQEMVRVPSEPTFNFQNPPYPGPYKTVVKNGVEYLQARGEVGKYGGTVHVSTIGQGPKTFNPWVSKDATSSEMAGLMFDSLFMTDVYTGKTIPFMAKDYSVSKDNLVYTVTMRTGLKWSDGEEITADDVVFTWDKIVATGLGNPSSRENLLVDGKFPEIKKINKYTVQFKTAKPFAPFLSQMGGIPIAPEHVLKDVVAKGDNLFSAYWGADSDPKNFVVSGKFILLRYLTGQRVEFKRNPNYFMVDKAGNILPYLKKYVVYIVGDQNNQLFKFQANEIDYIDVPGNNVAKMKEEEMKPKANFKIYNLGPATTTTFIVLNMNDRINPKTKKYYENPVKGAWFRNIYFRKAVDWAIDRKNIVNNVVQGVGAPLFTAESLSSLFLNKELAKGHSRNINKAKKYLLQGGFVYKGKNLYDSSGHRVEFTLLTNAGNLEREAIGVIVKEDLEELGMKVNFKPLEFNALVAKLTSFHDWDIVIIGLTGNPLEPHSGRNVWNSDSSLHMFNLRTGKDKETKAKLYPFEITLDEAFEKGASTLDFNERKKYYDQYQKIIADNLPMIYLYSPLRIIAVRKRLGNIKPTVLGGAFYNLEEIYIKD